MNYIQERDSQWHPMMVEMPPRTADNIELLTKEGQIVKGKIVVEMSGWYIYLGGSWGDIDDYTHWRFNDNRE